MIFAGRVSADDISGPVGIVTTIDQTVEQAAPAGNTVVAMVLVNFAILLSANLGVMNLLPLPALDGGRLVFLIIELYAESLLTVKKREWSMLPVCFYCWHLWYLSCLMM